MCIAARILLALFFYVSCVPFALPFAGAEGALTVSVQIGSEKTVVATYSQSQLQALSQKTAVYSSLDANGRPMTLAARGVTITTLCSALGIPLSDVSSMTLASSDGWSKKLNGGTYLRDDRYFYPKIISGYDENASLFLMGAEEGRTAVPALLALSSLEGKNTVLSGDEALSQKDGIRFCFGQTSIDEAVFLSYGKKIQSLTFVLKESTSFVLPTTPTATPTSSPSQSPNPGESEDDEKLGLRADTLTITVGYFGGPYYTKKVLTVQDLSAMQQVRQTYSFIDNMPAVVLDSAVGVRLKDILNAAGIDANSVETFHFYCSDVTHSWYQSINKEYLLDTTRYYYPNLPTRWDYDTGKAQKWAKEGAVEVETIIALKDNWKRFATAPDFSSMTTNTRFRLLFGQTDTSTKTASRSAKWIHTIQVTLGGTPPAGIALDQSALDLEVGSTYQLSANVKKADQSTDTRVTWSSSNTNAVIVDSSGKIKVVGEGSAIITATTVTGGLQASVVINGEPENSSGGEATPNPGSTDAPLPTGAGDSSSSGTSSSGTTFSTEGQTGEESGTSAAGGSVYEVGGEGPTSSVISNHTTPQNPGGGVQNWRTYEMSGTAVELPKFQTDTSLLPFVLIGAAVLFMLGGAARVGQYRRAL